MRVPSPQALRAENPEKDEHSACWAIHIDVCEPTSSTGVCVPYDRQSVYTQEAVIACPVGNGWDPMQELRPGTSASRNTKGSGVWRVIGQRFFQGGVTL